LALAPVALIGENVDLRTWFAVDGTLEPIDYDGPSAFRFPETVAEHIIERYSAPGDWIIDPFCGFGTSLAVAERLGREAVGYEVHERRAAFCASRLADPRRVIHGSCEDLAGPPWPPFKLLITSPPYRSFRVFDRNDDPEIYKADARRLFSRFTPLLAPGATVAVVVSQVRLGDRTRPVVWELGSALSELYTFREELIRVNSGPATTGPGYHHEHVLVFGVNA
jgi:DNA modification methylase